MPNRPRWPIALLLAAAMLATSTLTPLAATAQVEEVATAEAPALSVPPLTKDSCPDSHLVKGNRSGRQANRPSDPIYHVPGGRYYAETDPEECFATAEDAEA